MSNMASATHNPLTSLPFPPITPAHILNCSFHSWHPRFRPLTPKARLIPLSQPFLDYLRADGIMLPPENRPNDADSGFEDGFQNDEDEENEDPSEQWADIHDKIRSTIAELGGKVMPKLNWSAPKDATWIATTNDMECRTPNDVYLLLKSSDFITHDLEHAFDGCTISDDAGNGDQAKVDVRGNSNEMVFPEVPYHLVLRKAFNLNPALEFRCFVRQRKLIAISQREMNYFDFLFDLRDRFKKLIQEFLDQHLLPDNSEKGGKGFPDENFVVDVYIPPPHDRVWLIDINPWAPRTDPLLFSWLELLQLPLPEAPGARSEIRLWLDNARLEGGQDEGDEGDEEDDEEDDVIFDPEFRLVRRDDPEAYQFTATKYSAHKLPKEVVDASMAPGDMKNMMEEWRKVIDKQVQEDEDEDEEEGHT